MGGALDLRRRVGRELVNGAGRSRASLGHEGEVSYLVRGPREVGPGTPLIVALPGGAYTADYFDVPGCSLMERAAALGIPVVALDRPGYVASTPLPPPEATLERNAAWLDRAIDRVWSQQASLGAEGIVLVGHSIGGAIAVLIAARQPRWPLRGIAISGVGFTPPPEVAGAWASLPQDDYVSLPPEGKDFFMFGPASTWDPSVPPRTRVADAPTPRAELLDIVSGWPALFASRATHVTVPVHYRQAEFDKLWVVDQAEIERFGQGFPNSPSVDAKLCASAGHCIDFHRAGAAFQQEQLAFALRCVSR